MLVFHFLVVRAVHVFFGMCVGGLVLFPSDLKYGVLFQLQAGDTWEGSAHGWFLICMYVVALSL